MLRSLQSILSLQLAGAGLDFRGGIEELMTPMKFRREGLWPVLQAFLIANHALLKIERGSHGLEARVTIELANPGESARAIGGLDRSAAGSGRLELNRWKAMSATRVARGIGCNVSLNADSATLEKSLTEGDSSVTHTHPGVYGGWEVARLRAAVRAGWMQEFVMRPLRCGGGMRWLARIAGRLDDVCVQPARLRAGRRASSPAKRKSGLSICF